MEKKKILIVDDDVVILKLMRTYLEEDYDVYIVPSGAMAIKFLGKKATDLILLDYKMPQMDGIETFNNIKKLEIENMPKVFFLTGEQNEETIQKIKNQGSQGYIMKPVVKEDLLEHINTVL